MLGIYAELSPIYGEHHTLQALPCINIKQPAAKSITKGQHALIVSHFFNFTWFNFTYV